MLKRRKIEVALDGNSISVLNTGLAGNNIPEYYNLPNVKSISATFDAGFGVIDSAGNSNNKYVYDDKCEIVVNFINQDSNPSLVFDVQDVTNQPGWTADLLGVQQAVADINSWLVSTGGGTISGYALESTLQDVKNELLKQTGLGIVEHDHIDLTYVTAGNGIGEIETVVYKQGGAGGTTVATLTLAYDANDNLSSVTKS